jgi:hypothetical protein
MADMLTPEIEEGLRRIQHRRAGSARMGKDLAEHSGLYARRTRRM